MRTEKEIIKKIKLLKQIKPEKKWVFLTKEKILGKEPLFFPFLKPAFAGLLFVLILFGLSFTSLPGEPFYRYKEISRARPNGFYPRRAKAEIGIGIGK